MAFHDAKHALADGDTGVLPGAGCSRCELIDNSDQNLEHLT